MRRAYVLVMFSFTFELLPFWDSVTDCIIYTIVAYTVGWIGETSSILHGIIAAIFQIALAFIIWGGFMLHYRNDARKMNEKIKEL